MAPAVIYANQPKDFSLWDAHRDILQRLFLTEKRPLKEVKKVMQSEHNFPCDFTESMYETTLRDHLGFRKNLKSSEWEAIATHLTKRRGKKSDVIFHGNRLTDKRVDKEVNRHRPALRDGVATPPLPASIVISTPPADPPEAVPHPQSSEDTIMLLPRDDNTDAGTSLDIETLWSIVHNSDKVLPISRSEMRHLLEGQFSQARMNLPMNELALKLLHLLRFHRHQINTAVWQSLAYLHQMTGSPVAFGLNSSLGILLHVSYTLSNDFIVGWNSHDPFMRWVESVADIHLLRQFFSFNTPTTTAVWFSLVRDGLFAFARTDAIAEIWLEIGLTIHDGRLLQDNVGWCFDVLDGMSPAGQWRMLKRISQVGEAIFKENWPKYKSAMLKQQLRNSIVDQKLTKTVIDSGVSLPKSISLDWTQLGLRRTEPSMEAIKMLAEAGVEIFPRDTEGFHGLLCHDSFIFRRPSEKPRASQWDRWAEIVSLYSGPVKECVTLVGIAAAANKGLDSLRGYVRGKPHPLSPTKEAVLEITLSHMSDIGLQSIVQVLLQYGVDVEAKHAFAGGYIWSLPFSRPTITAVRKGNIGMMRLLAEYRADFNRRDVAEAIILEKSDIPKEIDCATEYYETLINLLLEFGLDLEQHGTRIMLKAIGLIGRGDKPHYNLIKVLQHRGVKWNKVVFDLEDFYEAWWANREVDRAELLHLAVRSRCSVETIRYLLGEGVQMHSRPCELDGKSILQAAFEKSGKRGVELIQLLLDHLKGKKEADPAWPEILELSVQTHVHDGDERCGDMRLYHRFKGLGAMPPGPTDPIRAKRRFGLIPDLIWLHAKDKTITDVWNNGNGFEQLHDEDRDRILIKTIESGGLSWARILIEHGANVNGQASFGGRPKTPLQQACDNESPLWFLEYLLGKGGNIMFDGDTGYTALHLAAEEGWLNLASLSLENHADVNAIWTAPDPDAFGHWALSWVNEDGVSKFRQPHFAPLDFASAHGRLDMVKFLLDVGGQSASPGQTGLEGALDLAEYNRFQGVAMLLRQESAKRCTKPVLPTYSQAPLDEI